MPNDCVPRGWQEPCLKERSGIPDASDYEGVGVALGVGSAVGLGEDVAEAGGVGSTVGLGDGVGNADGTANAGAAGGAATVTGDDGADAGPRQSSCVGMTT